MRVLFIRRITESLGGEFYLRAIAGSEGSECERYTIILMQLLAGLKKCSDEVNDDVGEC